MSIPARRLNMNRNERQSSSSSSNNNNNNTDVVQFGDWVADFSNLSSRASTMFNCAIDTTDNNNKLSNQREIFGNSSTMSTSTDVESVDDPVMKANEIFASPTPRITNVNNNNNNNRTHHHQVVHDPRNIARRRDAQCAETSNISGASNSLPDMDVTPDLERADDINISAVSAVSIAQTPVSTLPMATTLTLETKKTWDDLYEQNNPDPDRTNDTIHTKNTKLGEELTPEGRRKRKIMIAMGVILLAAILLSVGVVLLQRNHLSNNKNNYDSSSAEEAQGGVDEAVNWGGEFDNVLDTYSPTSTSSSYFPTSSPAKTIFVSPPTEEQDNDPEVDSTPISSETEFDTSPSYNNQADDVTAPSPSSSSSSSSGNDNNSEDSGIMAWPSSGNEPILIPNDEEGVEENVVQDSSSWINEETVASEQDSEVVDTEDADSVAAEQEQVNPIPTSNTNNEVITSPSISVSPPADDQMSSPTSPTPPVATPEAEPQVTGQPTTANPTQNPTPLPTTANPTTANPTPRPTTRATPSPISGLDAVASSKTQELSFIDGFAQSSESRVTIQLKTDGHGDETSWFLYRLDLDTNQLTSSSPIASVAEGTYADFEQDQKVLTLEPGKYRFTLKDKYGDGFCCSNGSDGWYVIYVDNKEIVRGAYYRFEKSHDFLVGFRPELTMTSRDAAWLEAHNVRRKDWHERHNKAYVPMVWSLELASDAQSWAEALLNDCDIEGISHESDVEEGENLAKNKGWDGEEQLGMGKLYPPENILRRWVDLEEFWGYPDNAHLTQSLWRASRYLGCGDSYRDYPDGQVCRVQVCRYVRAGNCAMNSFQAKAGDNWLKPMLMDDSLCGPMCPQEGCY